MKKKIMQTGALAGLIVVLAVSTIFAQTESLGSMSVCEFSRLFRRY
jgi:hypothetical protein